MRLVWFVKYKILKLRRLYHLVLPVKQEKLLFSLCVKYTQEKTKVCDHTEEQCAFSDIWASIEINKAIKNGYKFLQVYQVWTSKRDLTNCLRG